MWPALAQPTSLPSALNGPGAYERIRWLHPWYTAGRVVAGMSMMMARRARTIAKDKYQQNNDLCR